VNGTTLEYEQVGAGPTCVVLPGWIGADHRYLRPGLDCLARHLRLVYYDHRAGFSMEQAADDAAGLAGAVDAGPVLLLGHHTGASVAIEAALRHPERVRGLVLVGATPGELGRGESLADGFEAPPTPPEAEVLQRVPPGSDAELEATMTGLEQFFFHRLGRPEAGTTFARSTFSSAVARDAYMPLAWWSAVDRLGGLDVPALVLVGRHDVFHGPFQSSRIARHAPRATPVVLEESGHLPWVEEPGAFVGAVAAWLDAEGLAG
ncbi:MAG: alpha/beta fold hydrolase, partial [Acidimicrobiia bacterium]